MIVSDFRGLDYFLFERRILWPAFFAPVLFRTFGDWLQNFDDGTSLRLFSGGVGFSMGGVL